ncbi:hypothetical protein GCM10009077_03390 [Roseibium denhamense]
MGFRVGNSIITGYEQFFNLRRGEKQIGVFDRHTKKAAKLAASIPLTNTYFVVPGAA